MSAVGAIVRHDGRLVATVDIHKLQGTLTLHGLAWQAHNLFGSCALIACVSSGFTPEDAFERQPVRASGRRHVVFSGWISNREEVIESLGIRPRCAASLPDSAIAARAFVQWGEMAGLVLDGSFAMLIWDENTRTLYALRSAGIAPPLHYHHTPKRTLVSTSAAGLFALGDVDRRLDRVKLVQNLQLDFEDRTRSYFEGIERLPTGHTLTVRDGQTKTKAFYNPRDVSDVRFRNSQDYVEAARDLFQRSVADTLRATSAPAIALSSGLDSSSVAVEAMAQMGQEPLLAFTAVPEARWDGRVVGRGCTGDERGPVRSLAIAYPALQPQLIDCEGEDATAHLDTLLQLAELPPRNVTNIGWITAIAKATRATGKRVLITGDSGNATLSFALAPSHRQLLESGQIITLLKRLYRRLRASSPPASPGVTASWSAALPQWSSQARPAAPLIDPRDQMAEALFGGLRDEAGLMMQGLESLTGVQMRDPLGSRRLAEFCMGLPPEQFSHHGVSRALIKRVMGGRLPKAILEAPHGRQGADAYQRLKRRRCEIQHELAEGKARGAFADLIDFNRLLDALNTMPERTPISLADHPDYLLLHLGLPRALAGLRFAQWADN